VSLIFYHRNADPLLPSSDLAREVATNFFIFHPVSPLATSIRSMEGASTTSSTSSLDGRSSNAPGGEFLQQNDGGDSTGLDMNEFPSLGGGNLAQALRNQQLMKGYRLAMTGQNQFNMASEDFPALGSSGNNGSALLGGNNAVQQRNAPGSGIYAGSHNELEGNSGFDGGAGLLGGAGLGGLGNLRNLQQQSTGAGRGNASVSSSSATGSALSGDFGLLGLLGVIRMTDADRNALALGTDLTMLGLNLGTPDKVYSTFSSPWADNKTTKEPHYQVRIPLAA